MLSMSSIRATVLIGAVLLLGAQARIEPRPLQLTLSRSAPEDQATVESAPEIRLWFSEAPMEMGPSTVSIRVLDESGATETTGDGLPDPQDGSVFSLALVDPLGPGTHTVAWYTMAEDGVDVEGRFSFTIAAR